VRKKDLLNDWEKGIVPLMIPILLICGLIIKDNFSTAAMLFLLSMAMKQLTPIKSLLISSDKSTSPIAKKTVN
jgi:hypothetical protein